MRRGGRTNKIFTKLALIGMVFAIVGCSADSGAQRSDAETTETEDGETSENMAQEQDALQERETDAAQDKVQDSQEWETADEQTLRYAFAKGFGGRAGVCVPMAALSDEPRMELVKGQFNSVTMENEMKPETLLRNKPNIGEDGFPILGFTVPDMMLKEIKAYNDTAGKDGRKIMVRGHVLVWHSQTPEWFFHEEYNVDKPYVDKQTMLARMENYIRQVMEHYEGADSEYQGMIYAWDVVNEAVNDTDGGMRTDSSWFRVFSGSDFVEWAFVYANRYAPAHIKLFYNDYNDINPKKADGTRVQCPLLFDKDYQPKPAFWAFVDDSRLEPVTAE